MAGFDNAYYLANNPDVAAAVNAGTLENAYAHYSLFGQTEGRAGMAAPVAAAPAPAAPTFDYSKIPQVDYSKITGAVAADGGQTRDQMNTGFAGTNQNLATVNTNLTQGLGAVNTNLNTVNTAVTAGNTANQAGFAGMNTQLTDAATKLGTLGANQTTYFNALTEGQKANTGLMNTFSGNFNDFTSTYGKDVARADSARNDLQTGMAGNFNNLRTDLGERENAATTARSNILKAVGGNAAVPAQQPNGGFAGSATQMAAQQAPQAPQQNPVVAKVNQIRSILQTSAQQMDPRIAAQFSQVASAFDQQGQLIPNMNNPDGTSTRRALDPQSGLLYTATMGPNGPMSSNAVDVNQTFSMLDQMNNVQTPYGV